MSDISNYSLKLGFRLDSSCILLRAGWLNALLMLILDISRARLLRVNLLMQKGHSNRCSMVPCFGGLMKLSSEFSPSVFLPNMLPPVPVRAPAWDSDPWQVSSHPIYIINYNQSFIVLLPSNITVTYWLDILH